MGEYLSTKIQKIEEQNDIQSIWNTNLTSREYIDETNNHPKAPYINPVNTYGTDNENTPGNKRSPPEKTKIINTEEETGKNNRNTIPPNNWEYDPWKTSSNNERNRKPPGLEETT